MPSAALLPTGGKPSAYLKPIIRVKIDITRSEPTTKEVYCENETKIPDRITKQGAAATGKFHTECQIQRLIIDAFFVKTSSTRGVRYLRFVVHHPNIKWNYSMFSSCNLFIQHHIQYPKIRFGHSACPLTPPHRLNFSILENIETDFWRWVKGPAPYGTKTVVKIGLCFIIMMLEKMTRDSIGHIMARSLTLTLTQRCF